MREELKPEVALEILSMCFAIAIEKNDDMELNRLNNLKNRVYQNDKSAINEIIEFYGKKVKMALEEI